MHLAHHIGAADDQRAVARHAQRHVEHRAVLGDVDVLPGEHRIAPLGNAGFRGELHEEPKRLVGDTILREVEEQPGRLARQALGAARVGAEERAEVHAPDPGGMRLERLPRSRPASW